MVELAAPTWTLLPVARQAAAAGDVATLLRLARTAAQLTLEEAGGLLGYSAASMSRMETGKRRVTDVVLLRRLAQVYSIPPGMLGLTTTPPSMDTRQASQFPPGSMFSPKPAQEDEDPMRRRHLLAGLAAIPMVARAGADGLVSPLVSAAQVAPGQELLVALHDALLRPGRPVRTGEVDSPDALSDPERVRGMRADLVACMRDFQASRYGDLAVELPRLVRRAEVLSAGPDTSAGAAAVRAEVYNTVARVFIKFEVPGLGWMAVDRALTAARAAGDPAVLASCTRSAVSLCRRDRHYASAQDLALDACNRLTVTGPHADPAHLSLYGMLLGNAAYAAAQAGDRSRAVELLDLADDAARRVGSDRNEHWTAFGPTNVRLHRISVAFALGDAGTAIAHARTVNPADLRLPERRSRYWVDVARAYHQWGKPEQCYQALRIGESHAPQEVRARPVVRDLTRHLLAGPTVSPGVQDLAHRVGATA